MSGSVKLSIHPTFYCNYRCSYCYLGNLRGQKTSASSRCPFRQVKGNSEIIFNF